MHALKLFVGPVHLIDYDDGRLGCVKLDPRTVKRHLSEISFDDSILFPYKVI
ncbi:hypothetical protein BH10CYA1_BH10CYA1_51370 [soil metagenome]